MQAPITACSVCLGRRWPSESLRKAWPVSFEALCIDYSLNFWGAKVSNLLRSLGFSFFFFFFPQGVLIRKAVNEMSMGLSNKQNYLVVEKQGGNNERFF